MKKQLLRFIFFLSICFTLLLRATAQVVDIPDANLRAAIENTLGKASGAAITADEMATLTELNARDASISDLTGLGFATNLIMLRLHNNRITDILPLSSLTSLKALFLDGNNIMDISSLSGLIHLEALGLGRNNISDIASLAGLTHLNTLRLNHNRISDISPLVANTGLGSGDEVDVQENPLSHTSIKTHIPTLQSRGVTVEFDDTTHLNFGEPRTVRLIYFLPNDRPYRAGVVQWMKDQSIRIQTFYAEQMAAHGYGKVTFRVETDSQGEPIVHRVDGQHPDSYYLADALLTVEDEIDQVFDHNMNIYLIVVDNSIGQLCRPDGCWDGWGGKMRKQGGRALVTAIRPWWTAAHELGHTFGLGHDFRDGAYIMSYGPGQDRLSQCHAEFLSVHPYFNLNIPIEEGERPTIELISPRIYSAEAKSISIRAQISDSDGLHQVLLHAAQPDNRGSVKSCHGFSGERSAIIEFDYDGVIPSAHDSSYSISTSLLNSLIHPIRVEAIDTDGNVGSTDFVLFSEALEPLTKISGDNQHGLPNTPLPVPFVVELRDLNNGFPRYDVWVTFTVTAGGGTLSVERVKTDDTGRAESTLTLDPNFGTNTVEVSAEGFTVIFNAVVGAPVEIPDPNLRMALGKAQGQPIAPAEMATLTRLEARNANISNLTGLDHATNLVSLHLMDNNISDISQVRGLTNLTRLELVGNNISDLSPLAGLTNLTELYVEDNNISDISALLNLTNLEGLGLNNNSISDLSPLAGLTSLRWMGLVGNNISDLSPLVANMGLGSGDKVDVRGNPLNYLSIMAHIPALQRRGVTVEFDDTEAKPPDVNGDGNINVLDLILIASNLGNTGTNLAADIDGNGVVNVLDLVLAAGMFDVAVAAPAAQPQVPEALTAVEVHGWLTNARALEVRNSIMKRGCVVLEQLLVSLTPKETELLANYPNPFNPETWIPYRLAEDAFVTLTIYDLSGRVTRTFDVGHRIASAYENRSKAIYWDGKNNLGEQVASGIYFYQLRVENSRSETEAGDYSATRKMVILK